ncbi:hypothetical protein LTR36_002660 [Oleoguttula mirabilis]|uniref:Actin binding protein n=1 Tax=Oleoguttula mirabilis TaxID=1507867 RepID=A0AAV9JKD8_9PEZI|nr:hypothetical protein LTR36_002660 [Oleoguttula mirabilis]
MATLNTSSNGPSISASYQKIVNGPAPSASSPTHGQWALYTVQAPLASAFQQDSGKESVLKVQTTGEGELVDLIEEFSDGRIQFAFVKVKDPNTGLPKSVLIAWCGEGVPERTKGYFTSHLNAVSKILHGYHVQVTARSDRDLTPEMIVQKVADSSGSRYSGGGAAPAALGPRPPVTSKPSMPTKSFGGGAAGGFQPMASRSRAAPAPSGPVDGDGWGHDAPEVTRSQLEKVDSAYKPTKVNMAQLQSQNEPSRYQPPPQASNGNSDVVRGGYQPIGKVDLNALRKQAQEQPKDDRPTVVKGAYEPVGKVNIAEIRRKAQGAPPAQAPPPSQPAQDEDDRPKSLADRSAAFTSSERLTSLPKPQVANRFGSGASNFTGTKAPAPGGFEAKPSAPAAPVGAASRTFADQGGKTPAQQWEEKRRARGLSGAADTQAPSGAPASPIQSQASGQWQSQYGGKKWGVQIPSRTGGSGVSTQKTGQDEEIPEQQEPEHESGGISSIRDRFKDTAPMGAARDSAGGAPEPPPLDTSSKPNAGARGVPMPGLPQRPQQQQEDVPAEEHLDLPPPPPRPMPADEPEDEDEDPYPQGSPVRIAMPVARNAEPEEMEAPEPLPPRALPTASLNDAISQHKEVEPESQVAEDDPARSAGQTAAATTFGHTEDARSAGQSGGKEAIAQYDYEKAEDNELELREGERVTNIDMVDDDWWMGQNSRGESGLFPSNYVELVEGGNAPPSAPARHEEEEEEEEAAAPPAPARSQAAGGKTATAQYDYEAAEDNELSFPDGATVTDVEFPDDDWWFGHYGGKSGLFPANYVQLDE